MGRTKKERIGGVVINRYDGDESASVVGGASTVTTAPNTMPTNNPKDIPVSTPVNPQTGETAGSGTPSTPSAEVPSKDPAGGSGTVSGEGSGSGETGSGEPSKTYGDYVTEGYEGQKEIINSNFKSYEQFWNGYLANAESSNAKEREAAEQRAETERQRGVIDGQASYDFNKATYGKQAEALRSMGLSGSGYADYLTSRAYATQRAEVQGANAQAATAKRLAYEAETKANSAAKEAANKGIFDAKVARDSALMDSKTTYLEGMLKFEENKDITYKTLIEAATSGTYSPEVLTRMAKEAGLDETQIAEITNAYETSKSEKNIKENQEEYETVLELAKSGKYSDEELRSIGEGRGLTPEQITSVINSSHSAKEESKVSQGTAEFDVLLGYAKSGDYTIDELNALMKNTNLTYNQRESIISAATDVAKAGKSAVQEENYQEFLLQLDAGELDFDAVTQAHLRQEISGSQLKALKETYLDRIDTTENVYITDGEYLPYNDAKAALDKALSDPWLDASTRTKLQSTFDNIYGGVTSSNIKLYDGNEKGRENGNIQLMDTKTRVVYRVDYGPAVDFGANPKMKAATARLPNGSVFRYGDGKTLYVKVSDNKVCAIKARPATGGDDYNLLWKVILG